MTQDRASEMLEHAKAKLKGDKPLEILYGHYGLGTPNHPANKIAEETIDVFQKVAKTVPGTYYHKMKTSDQIWAAGESYVPVHTSTEMVQAVKVLEETGRPTLSYNNGVYCFVGYETQGKTDEYVNVDSEIYLFTDPALASALKKEIGEMGSGYVPCSNGEMRGPHIDNISDNRWVDMLQDQTKKAKQKVVVEAKIKGTSQYS